MSTRKVWILALPLALAFAVHCGGRVDTPFEPGSASASRSTAQPVDASLALPTGCSSIVVHCQPFDDDNDGRWGCNTDGTAPELACEHAAGASLARCNCAGQFGEGTATPYPSGEAGAPVIPTVQWFDAPATATAFSDAEVTQLWLANCNGVCAPLDPVAPPLSLVDSGATR